MPIKQHFFVKLLVLVSALAISSGCTSIKPTDLTANEVKLIDVKEVTGKELDNGRYIRIKNHIPRIEVGLNTGTDIFSLYKENSLYSSVQAFFCDAPDEEVLLRRSGLLLGGREINDLLIEKIAPLDTDTYKVVIGLYSPPIDGGSIKMRAYDLVSKPKDICLTLSGATIPFVRYRSNTAVISGEKIKSILEGSF